MTLEQLRKGIDRLDRKIVALLNERAQIALRVGELKWQQNLPIVARGREQEVYAHLAAMNAGPLENEQLNRIYLRIMREMKQLQRGLSTRSAAARRRQGAARAGAAATRRATAAGAPTAKTAAGRRAPAAKKSSARKTGR
ncbi:MAG: chorismate mutase [Candidatus Tectomicrobia bacterium]|nr:chorismate mutase [Candidatus Tectomicrobia bacterium]